MFSLLKHRPFNYSLGCEMYSNFRRFALERVKGLNCITDTSVVDFLYMTVWVTVQQILYSVSNCCFIRAWKRK